MNDNTERPDTDRARKAMHTAPADVIRTAGAVAESKRLAALVRETRERNHVAEKLRLVITGYAPAESNT